jgi:hypothetical protein
LSPELDGDVINIISATRLSHDDFLVEAPLGASLKRLAFDKRIYARVAFENRTSLSEIYNLSIDYPKAAEILVFIHDDVWLDDYFFAERIIAGLQNFDILGIAGNRRRLPRQPSWCFTGQMSDKFIWDVRENLSGAVAHGTAPFGRVTNYGPVPAQCELLDGVLLAARRDTLRSKGVRFDFHFYDLDFCRSARAAGLVLGTGTGALTHLSQDAFGSADWQRNYEIYLEKWGE